MSVLPSALFVGLLASVASAYGEPASGNTTHRSAAPHQGTQVAQQQDRNQREQSVQSQGQAQSQGNQAGQQNSGQNAQSAQRQPMQQGQSPANQSAQNQPVQQGQNQPQNQNQGNQSAQNQSDQSDRANLRTNAAGATVSSDRTIPGARGMIVECRPSAVDCPVQESSGSSVTTTDSLPLGSTVQRGVGETVDESSYPTSPGTGNLGSGSTGAPPGPRPGPALGIGRGGEG